MSMSDYERNSRLRIAAYRADLVKQLIKLEDHHTDLTDLEHIQVVLGVMLDAVRVLVRREYKKDTE